MGLEVSGVGLRWQDFDNAVRIFAFDQLDFIVEMSGIEDTDGVITGVPGKLITSPVDVAELLLHYYESNNWQPGLFDRTKFIDSHEVFNNTGHVFYRKVNGRTYGNTTNLQLLREVMRNTYSTLMYDGFGDNAAYGVVGVGKKREIKGLLTDHDGQFQRFFFNDINTVVNSINLNHSRRLDNVHFQKLADQEQFGEYSNTFTAMPNDGGLGESLSNFSYVHYGVRGLGNENFDFLGDNISAAHVAELYLRIHEHPFQLVQFEGLYSAVKDFRLYDLIYLQSTELPNRSGTSAKAYPNKNECGIIGDVANAALYVGEIIAIGFNYQPQSLPSVTLLFKLLTNENDPLIMD